MRLKLKLRTQDEALTPNYYYPLSASVYRLLQFGSEKFASFLHDIGYSINNKTYKLFTFALKFDSPPRFVNGVLKLPSHNCWLYISSPLVDEFIKSVVIGTFENQKLSIASGYMRSNFIIEQAEIIPEIDIKDKMSFKLLSPIVLSTTTVHNGKLSQYYLRYNDNEATINQVINNNLKNKFQLVNNKEPDGLVVKFDWNRDYINKQEEKGKRVTRKQTIKQESDESTEVIGTIAPFNINGSPELIKVGYECGFGERNSMGFGMAETTYF